MERLHKYLAHCGIASRRKAEALIREGRVKVNGQVVTELGVQIDPKRDAIAVDGKPVRTETKVYYLLNKPRDCVTTAADEYGRRTVLDLLKGIRERIYPVGRLDRDSEGLLVLTNDGDLAYYLTHPACGVHKTYRATVDGHIDEGALARLVAEGLRLGPLRIQPLACKLVRHTERNSVVEVVVGEGINREVRRLFAGLGHEVRRLTRIRIGPLTLKGLSRGRYRAMRPGEIRKFARAMEGMDLQHGDAAKPPAPERPPRRPRKHTRYHGPRGERLGKPDPAHSGPSRQCPGRKPRKKARRAGRPNGTQKGKRHPLT